MPLLRTLQLRGDELLLTDADHCEIALLMPQVGETVFLARDRASLTQPTPLCYEVTDADNIRWCFERVHAGSIAVLKSISDASGNTTRIDYDGGGRPIRVADSAGRTLSLVFNRQNRLALVAEVRERESGAPPQMVPLAEYGYTADGDLALVRNRGGEVTREFAYRNHMLVRHSRPRGLVSEYEYSEYSARGRVILNRSNIGQAWRFNYQCSRTIVSDQLGRSQIVHFDEQERFTGSTDALGNRCELLRDTSGNAIAVTDEAGRSTRYRYDERGRPVCIETPDGGATTIAYHSVLDRPATITDAAGGTATMEYDEHGNLTAVTDALGRRCQYRYDERGLPVKRIDARGGIRQLAYNLAGQLICDTDAAQRSTHFEYDADGRLMLIRDHGGHCTRFRYDRAGRLLSLVYPDNSEERREYDDLGRLVSLIDAGGHRTRYTYDLDDKPLACTGPLGGIRHYRYDGGGRLAQLVDENGAVSSFVHDLLDRLIEETGVDGCVTRYAYDTTGMLVEREEIDAPAAGEDDVSHPILTRLRRDAVGRVVEKTVTRAGPDGNAEQLHTGYRYDLAGRLVHAANDQAQIDLLYDAAGQLTMETTSAQGRVHVLSHAYDVLGRRVLTTLPGGQAIAYSYDEAGCLRRVQLDGCVVTEIERDASGRETSRTQGGLTSHYAFDPAGRLRTQVARLSDSDPGDGSDTCQGGRNVVSRRYDYDKNGTLNCVRDMRAGRSAYSYDAATRILELMQQGMKEIFRYDPAHNLIDPRNPPATGGKLLDHRIARYGALSYTYDSHGNVTRKRFGDDAELRLAWNAQHQLVLATADASIDGCGMTARVTAYGYDPFGRRLFKRDDAGTTRFIWDGDRLLAEEREGLLRLFLYEPDSFIPLAQALWKTGASASPAALQYFHVDHAGMLRELTDAHGQLRWAATYRTWGKVLKAEIAGAQETIPDVLPPEELQPLRFQGQYFDAETGLHYNRFRYYDPDIGRFLGKPPAALRDVACPYRYAPNPTGWICPSGLTASCLAARAGAQVNMPWSVPALHALSIPGNPGPAAPAISAAAATPEFSATMRAVSAEALPHYRPRGA